MGRRGARPIALILAAAMGVTLGVGTACAVSARPDGKLDRGQYNYMLACGGCHGLTGVATGSGIPDLSGRVGVFFCSREGREYVIRLPNVAFADMDDAALAETMNYVMFTLGGESVPAGSAPYSAEEIELLRTQPLKNSRVIEMAAALRSRARMSCFPDL